MGHEIETFLKTFIAIFFVNLLFEAVFPPPPRPIFVLALPILYSPAVIHSLFSGPHELFVLLSCNSAHCYPAPLFIAILSLSSLLSCNSAHCCPAPLFIAILSLRSLISFPSFHCYPVPPFIAIMSLRSLLSCLSSHCYPVPPFIAILSLPS